MDYEMMCGIEIHKQLDTKKMFCSCDTVLCDEGFGAQYRKQRPTTSEMGEDRRAALAQHERHMEFRYQCCHGCSCLWTWTRSRRMNRKTKRPWTSRLFSPPC